MNKKNFLVTGCAGFIGFHLTQRLLKDGHTVVGIDSLNNYYSPELKNARVEMLMRDPHFKFHHFDINNKQKLFSLFESQKFETIFHLAAQAGVRYSLESPKSYTESNIDGTLNILEAARHLAPKTHLMLASSSSVYGLSKRYPFSESEAADQPVALYGATKRATELMAHAYSHLFGLRTTMLRFFSVYGPWGRPDVALYKFADQMVKGETIEVYNGGDMIRDFTYVDDIVDGMIALDEARRIKTDLPLNDIFNIGCSHPRTLKEFIENIEKCLGVKSKQKMLPFQPGDIYKSMADISKIQSICKYEPKIQMEEGIRRFIEWYKTYHRVK